jgi:hypothetical protein
MADISARIQELHLQLETIERSQRYRDELKRKVQAAQQAREQLVRAVDKERQDVVELESWSLKELFVKMTDREEKLEKEKEEYLQAAIALKEADKEVEMIEFEIGVLEEKIGRQAVLKAELQSLYDQREADLIRDNPGHPLKPILLKLARLRQIERELEEALERGGEVRLILIEVGRHIHAGKNWSHNVMRDRLYRRRMIAEEVDGARLRLPKLRMEFVKFESEVKELFQFPEFEQWKHDHWAGILQIKQLVQDLTTLTQSFVKGIFQDMAIQRQLHSTLTLIDNLGHQIAASLKWLRLELDRIKEELAGLENEKRQLLS